MDCTAMLRHLGRFCCDERGGESVEYALTSAVSAVAALAAQQAMAEQLSAFAATALDHPTSPP